MSGERDRILNKIYIHSLIYFTQKIVRFVFKKCRKIITDVILIQMIGFAVKHIANIRPTFLSDGGLPNVAGPGKFPSFSLIDRL